MRRFRPTAKQLLFLLMALASLLMPWHSSINSDSPNKTTAEPLTAAEPRRSSITNSPADTANSQCPGTGLAAVDLAVNRRATPRAIMGALEAVAK